MTQAQPQVNRSALPDAGQASIAHAPKRGQSVRRAGEKKKGRAGPRAATPTPPNPAAAPARLGPAGQTVAAGVARSLSSLQSVESEIADLVQNSLSLALRGGALVGTQLSHAVADVVNGALEATQQAGAELGLAARGVARGVVKGAADVRADVGAASAEMLRVLIKHAQRVGADVAQVTRRAVDGLARAVNEAGYNLSDIGRVALQAVFAATRRMGRGMTASVRAVLVGVAEGLDPVLDALGPAPKKKSASAAASGVGQADSRRHAAPTGEAGQGPAAQPKPSTRKATVLARQSPEPSLSSLIAP
jgi:hypothetical protein